jgi:hypothetical protein
MTLSIIACLAAALALLPLPAVAADPFAAAAAGPKRLARVTSRVIEVPSATLTEWLSDPAIGGPDLHGMAVELALAGSARIIDTMIITTCEESRASVGSIRELIYPIENELPEPPASFKWPNTPRYAPTSFERRNTGFMQEIEVTIGEGIIDLRIDHELTEQSGSVVSKEFVDRWGNESVRHPLMDTKQVRVEVPLVDGRFHLLGVHTHSPVAMPEPPRKWMVFVKADILVQEPAP